jgi:steroid delta-isomerase-like uncharacterized protein
MGTAKEIVDRGISAWRAGDADAYAQLYSEDCEIVTPGGMTLRGRDGAKQFIELWYEACPDNELRIEREHEAGSTVVHEATFVGTHTGNLRTPDGQVIAPTGRRLEVRYAFAFTVEGDLIQSVRGYFDQVDVLTQVGLMPEPAPGARVSG